MRTKRSVTRLIATVAVAGAITTALTVAAPDVYHDMKVPAATGSVAVNDSGTTPGATTDVYHDM
jgi:hypothetical protein